MPDRLAQSASRPAVGAEPSPKAARLARPRWTDARLLFGVLLVVTSVVLGSRVLAGASRTQLVWAARHDLGARLTLTGQDVELRSVRLDSVAGAYLGASGPSPLGLVLARPVAAGELLPAAAVEPTDARAADRRQVTVPVATFHYPAGLGRGDLVDVYVTAGSDSATGSAAGDASVAPTLVLARALVVSLDDAGSGFGGASSSVGVVLSVPVDDVSKLVSGLRQGSVDLVGVPSR
jgi:hypothetical protein